MTAQVRYRQVSASLGSLGCVLAVFLTVAAALWSELVIDRQAMPPLPGPAQAALLATDVISAAMLALLALAVLAALPVLVTLAVRFLAAGRAGRKALRNPAAVLLGCATFLFTGGRHFGNGWPGTGGHGSFVPAGLAAFEWATSLSVSAYWAHPAASSPCSPGPRCTGWDEPLALAASVIAAAILIRRAGLPPRVLAFEVRLAVAACAVMAVVLGGGGLLGRDERGQPPGERRPAGRLPRGPDRPGLHRSPGA